MDLLGAPTETDLVEMGLQHPGLFYTVGALTGRIQGRLHAKIFLSLYLCNLMLHFELRSFDLTEFIA